MLRRSSNRPEPTAGEVTARLAAAVDRLCNTPSDSVSAGGLRDAADVLEGVNRDLQGTPGVACLLSEPDLAVAGRVSAAAVEATEIIIKIESELDASGFAPERELLNEAVIRVKDACWAISNDRVGMARAVADLAGGAPPQGALLAGLWSIQVALASLDRLEVRGRDSAGLHVLVSDHGLDLDDPEVRVLLTQRASDPLFTSMAVRTAGGSLSFVYKAAAEIGELGDNVKALRAAIRDDQLLAMALSKKGAHAAVLGHTRWASVGMISEANAHPVNSEELDRPSEHYVVAALNGDVDNHAELRASESLCLPPEVSTDAKVIPTLIARRRASGGSILEAFTTTVRRFEGSVAIAAADAAVPDELFLALRGSGQSLHVGMAEDAFVVASEPYGLVEETSRYLRLDGEATQGQIVVLRADRAGCLDGISRFRYDGAPLPIVPEEVAAASITTRDVDRAGFPHFLLKEISEAPRSFRKTLAGRMVTGEGGLLEVCLGEDAVPQALREALAADQVRRVLVIGQGTAAVAGQAVAAAVSRCLPSVPTTALPATELSGFGLTDDMSDALVIAISQSGTTTDTNRTVDLARGRGATVLGVVNRRNSDLAAKVHGVVYTSDGRDVEMSVASTKAFYSQVAAGWLLALTLGEAAGVSGRDAADRLLRALRDLPSAMERVLESRSEIARVAASVAPPRRYWAVVGSGPDRVAASELRIKLSELCYKAIACDATEDKKHIDLSSEPLIVVCAAGLSGPNADDVAKEVAIYRAHKAVPVVIATSGEARRFADAIEVVEVPQCEPDLAFVLSAMVGHIFGYEAALAIDAQARPLREARAAIEAAVGAFEGEGDEVELLKGLAPALERATRPFLDGLRAGAYNGHMEAATAVRLVSLLRYATGVLPVEGYELESGKVGSPWALIGDLFEALSAGIDELTRPVDAIKHQAKTVTVGISRSEDALFARRLVQDALAAGAASDSLGYRALRTLANLDPAVDEVLGYTRYRIDPPGPDGVATITVVDQGGVARSIVSSTSTDPRLRGTKHRAYDEREVTVARGRRDGRTVVLVPEVKGPQVTGMTLLHVKFHDLVPAGVAKDVLSGYRDRYSALRDAVTETEPLFDDGKLGEVPIVDLLTEPVLRLADHWRGAGAAEPPPGATGSPGQHPAAR